MAVEDSHDDGHHHEHGHDDSGHHRHGRVARFTGALFGHSHDAADTVDDALEATAQGRRALLICLGGLLLTAGLQAIVVVLSHSVAFAR
jgi:hypothetical protein